MIGTAFAAIAIGISALPSARKRPTSVATRMPSAEPIAKPPSASLNVYQPGRPERVPLSSQNACTMSLGFGSRNCWTWKSRDRALPERRSRARRRRAPAPTRPRPSARAARPSGDGRATRAPRPSASSSSGSRCSPRLRSSSRTCGHELEEARRPRGSRRRAGWGRSIVDDRRRSGPAAGSSRRRASRGTPPPRSSA